MKKRLAELVLNKVLPHSWGRIRYIVFSLIEVFKYNCHLGTNLNPNPANLYNLLGPNSHMNFTHPSFLDDIEYFSLQQTHNMCYFHRFLH